MSLRNRLWLVAAGLVLLPLLIGGGLVAAFVPARLDTAAWRAVDVGVASAASGIARDCKGLGEAGSAAAFDVLGGQPPKTVLSGIVATSLIDYAAFLDSSGKPVTEVGTRLPRALSAPSCSIGRPGGRLLAERVPVQIASMPQLAGVLVIRVIDSDGVRMLRSGLDASSQLVIGDGAQVVASSTNPRRSAAILSRARAGTSTHVSDAASLIARRPPSAGVPFLLAVSTPRPDRARLFVVVAGITLGGVLLALVIGRRLARSLTLSLADVTAAAERVASGHLDTHLRVTGRDEVGRLARAFNEMITELAAQRAEVERSHEEVRAGLDRMETMLASTHDLERLLAVVLATAVAATRARAGVVCSVEPDGAVVVVATHGLPPAEISPRGLRVGEGILGRVAEGGVAVGKIGTTADLLPVAGEPGARYILGVPIRRTGRVVGVLAVYDRHDLRSGTTVAFGRDQEREVRSIAGAASAAFENVLLHQEAQRLSITDPLTGLGNYRLLSTTLSREIERAQRFNRPLSVLMLDLDHFKLVNDQHGHPRGDAVLRELSMRLQEQLREVDVPARYGGEEFAVILPETDEAGAVALTQRIGHALRSELFCEGGDPLRVTASVGVAVMNPERATPALLMRAADGALYEAKNAGRDTWAVAPEGFHAVPGRAARPGAEDGAGPAGTHHTPGDTGGN